MVVASVSEVIGDCYFSSSNYICKYNCVLLFCNRISLKLFLRRWQRWGN